MQNSLSSDHEWIKRWSNHMIVMAHNNDLSSREIERHTDTLVAQASNLDLGEAIKVLLNHIRTHE